MADYKTIEPILKIVYGLLNGTIDKQIYMHTKTAKNRDAEYIVINAFPLSEADVMQKFLVNVNYHVQDIKDNKGPSGIPDITKLQAGSEAVLAILKKYTAEDKTYLIDFEKPEIIREEALQEHYSNLRFKFNYINR